MSATEILTIGSIVKHRGEYNANTTYYLNNQVTMYNCVFLAIGNDFSGIAPAELNADGSIQLANTTTWKCIIDNVTLYNASLSTHNLDSRTTELEKGVETLNAFSATKGTADGLAPLDENSKVPLQHIPNEAIEILEFNKIVDNVEAEDAIATAYTGIVYDTSARTFYAYVQPLSSATYYKKWDSQENYKSTSDNLPYKGKIYLNTSTKLAYLWSGTELSPIEAHIVFGTTDGTVFSGKDGAELRADLDGLIGTVELTALDTLVESIAAGGAMAKDTGHARWTVTKDGIKVGVLELFSDGQRHQMTQVLTSNYNAIGGTFGEHYDNEVRTYYRVYNMTSSSLENAKGTWSEWSEVVPKTTQNWIEHFREYEERTVALTQAEYDALVAAGTVDAETYYNVFEEDE